MVVAASFMFAVTGPPPLRTIGMPFFFLMSGSVVIISAGGATSLCIISGVPVMYSAAGAKSNMWLSPTLYLGAPSTDGSSSSMGASVVMLCAHSSVNGSVDTCSYAHVDSSSAASASYSYSKVYSPSACFLVFMSACRSASYVVVHAASQTSAASRACASYGTACSLIIVPLPPIVMSNPQLSLAVTLATAVRITLPFHTAGTCRSCTSSYIQGGSPSVCVITVL